MSQKIKHVALITGASAGLGAEMARLAARDGHDVVLVARNEAKLRELASELEKSGVSAQVVPQDLTDRGAPERIFAACRDRKVDVLFNNAGFGSSGPFLDLDLRHELEMVDVNMAAVVALTHLFAKPMRERGFGRICNVASTAGFQPGPFMATYYASKAFVISFSEAIAYELRGTGVTVTCHCPSATATEFAGRAGNDKSSLFQQRRCSGRRGRSARLSRHPARRRPIDPRSDELGEDGVSALFAARPRTQHRRQAQSLAHLNAAAGAGPPEV